MGEADPAPATCDNGDFFGPLPFVPGSIVAGGVGREDLAVGVLACVFLSLFLELGRLCDLEPGSSRAAAAAAAPRPTFDVGTSSSCCVSDAITGGELGGPLAAAEGLVLLPLFELAAVLRLDGFVVMEDSSRSNPRRDVECTGMVSERCMEP